MHPASWITPLADHRRAVHRHYPDDHLLVAVEVESLVGSAPVTVETIISVLRWFQIQKKITVGFVSRRSGIATSELVRDLQKYAKNHRFNIDSSLIFFPEKAATDSEQQRSLLEVCTERGYRLFAYLGLEKPANSSESLRYFNLNDIALDENITGDQGAPHASLIHLITEEELPEEIEYCWHGINDHENLEKFLQSSVTWGEVDVRAHPVSNELITRHDSFSKSPAFPAEKILSLEDVLFRMYAEQKKVKIDFKQGGEVVDHTLEMLRTLGYFNESVWFHGDLPVLRISGFQKLFAVYPEAIVQTTIDQIAPFIALAPPLGRWLIRLFSDWGANRFLLTWKSRYKIQVMEKMERWGYPVNLYQIPNLEEFLKAVLLLPASITSDFNFPEWKYYGRGSGQDLTWHEYHK